MSEIPHPNITRLAVRNYRSLKDVDVGLRPLTVLVGENSRGKSNMIDVRRFPAVGGTQAVCAMR